MHNQNSRPIFKNSKREVFVLPDGQDIHAAVPSSLRHWSISLPVWMRTNFRSQRICFAFQVTLWAECTVPALTKISSFPSSGGGWSDRCQVLSRTPTAWVHHKMPSHPGSELKKENKTCQERHNTVPTEPHTSKYATEMTRSMHATLTGLKLVKTHERT